MLHGLVGSHLRLPLCLSPSPAPPVCSCSPAALHIHLLSGPRAQKHLLPWLPQLWLPGRRTRAARVRGNGQQRRQQPGSRRCSAEAERALLASGARRLKIWPLLCKALLASAQTGYIPAAHPKWCNEKVSTLKRRDGNNPRGIKSPRLPPSV